MNRFRIASFALRAIFGSALLGWVSACGVVQNLQDMHDDTEKLRDMTASVVTMTGGLVGLTTTLLDENGDLRDKASEAYTYQTRHFALEEMTASSNQVAKLKAAAAYVVAFGFQAWNNKGNDTRQSLDDDLLVSVQEFLRGMVEYMANPDERSVSPTKTDQRSLNLYALSAVLQEISEDQKKYIAKTGRAEISLLSVIETSLTDNYRFVRKGIKTYKDLPDWENEVLTHYPDIVYLLQVRANFLAAIFLAQISDIQKTGFLGIPGLINKVEMLTRDWTARTPELNDSSLASFTTFLIGVNETRSLLASIGEGVKINSQVMKIFGHMRIPAEPKALYSRASLLQSLQREVNNTLQFGR